MKTTAKTLIIMVVVTIISLLAWQNTKHEAINYPRLLTSSYQTSSTRTTTVTKLCPANLNRSNLYSQSDLDASTQYQASVTSAINIDGYIINLVQECIAWKFDKREYGKRSQYDYWQPYSNHHICSLLCCGINSFFVDMAFSMLLLLLYKLLPIQMLPKIRIIAIYKM